MTDQVINPGPEILYDKDGRPFIIVRPHPSLMSAPILASEFVELWRANLQAAAWSAKHGLADLGAFHEARAAVMLRNATIMDPILAQMAANPPHYGTQGAS